MSSVLFDSAADNLRVQHNANNLCDRNPMFIDFSLSSNIHAVSDKIHHLKVVGTRVQIIINLFCHILKSNCRHI